MTRLRFAATGLGLFLLWPSVASAQLGTLIQDGPPTPEQISMYLPVTGTLAATTGAVRYRPTSGSNWTTAHPLFRIRPQFSDSPVADAFAGVITGLTPGTSYTVEVTVSLGASDNVQTLVATTRALPGPAGTPNKTIAAGSTPAQIQAVFNALNPGDVVQFDNGTYNIVDLTINRSGTQAQPIYIRGASRTGVTLHDPSDHVLFFQNASDIIVEDLTLEGSDVDSGTDSQSEGVRFWDGFVQQRVTVRRVTMRGVDKGMASDMELRQLLMYDCTLFGNNVWTQPFLETNLTWNDDGIRIPGFGNCAFNNTLSGFGDAFAVDNGVEDAAIHFYRNDVRYTDDDGFEADYAFRNITFYDNRLENSMTLVSFDPLNGGPAFIFRNISINTGRSPFKLNSPDTGHFIYNNTIVATNHFGAHAGWGWVQFDNGDQSAWGYRNNILIYRGSGHLLAMESGGQNPIDFTNNAWYPDQEIWWTSTGGSFSSLAAARAGLGPTTPVFGTSTHRHENDVICESNPFTINIALGSSYLTQVTTPYVPTLASGSVPRGAGIAIPGITDGYSGSAPDMGAIITGMTPPQWGDRSGGVSDTVPPAPPTNLRPR